MKGTGDIPIYDELLHLTAVLEDRARLQSLTLENNVSDPALCVYGNQAQIRKILWLVLTTCIENSTINSTITIAHSVTPSAVEISFRLSPNQLFLLMHKRLLEPREMQVTTATLRTSPDSSIPLLLARRIAASQRVKLWIDVENSNECTIHCLFLTSPIIRSVNRDRPLILVIEDNKHIRKLLELYMNQAGFDTIAAADGDEGLAQASAEMPDLITLDVMMPSRDGWQVLRALKENSATRPIPVIIVSVMKDIQIGYELGASDYITKPVEHDQLIESVRRLTLHAVEEAQPLQMPIKTLGVIDPELRAMESLLAQFKEIDLLFFESETATLFQALQSSLPDAFLCVMPAEKLSMLPLIYRLKLHEHASRIPIVATADCELTEQERIAFDGIIDTFLPIHSLTEERFTSRVPAAL